MSTTLEQDSHASHWGIDPVPPAHRKLTGFDIAVLWGDLGIGLLVIVAGALLTASPDQFGFGLSIPAALIATVVGSGVGCVLLGVGGSIAAREGRPTMVLLRSVLGIKGSWVPTVLNVFQLIGWTAFELWAMALVADRLSARLFGFSSFGLWLVLFALVVMALAQWGPLGVVRVWMEKFGAWVIVGIGGVITVSLLTTISWSEVMSRGVGSGSLVFGLPMDLVIAMPVSWVPLVADYNRYANGARPSFWGTTAGYAVSNVWFYMLGALIVVGLPVTEVSPEGVATAILSLGGISLTGVLLLSGLLVGETDEAFANVYSGAVSLRNILPRANPRLLVTLVTVVGTVLAASFTMLTYELFLFLLGSVFVPLLGVWFCDYFVHSNNDYERQGVRWSSFVAWVAGFALYHWIAPTPLDWWQGFVGNVAGAPLSSRITWLGASIPSFAIAFGVHLVIGSSRKHAKV